MHHTSRTPPESEPPVCMQREEMQIGAVQISPQAPRQWGAELVDPCVPGNPVLATTRMAHSNDNNRSKISLFSE